MPTTPRLISTLVTLVCLVPGSNAHLPSQKRALKHEERAKLFQRAPGDHSYPPMDQIGPQPMDLWVSTYNAVKAAGSIPGFQNSTNQDGWPVYPSNINPADPDICSFSLAKCTTQQDIVNAPDNQIGISFDDGPQDPSPEMYNFLSSNGIPSTHFLIGSRIIENPNIFQQVYQMGGHLACHTWSHPLMSTLTDMQILGELGWTMQVIYDYSNGVVPAFWRPPYGDVDNRVRAIAENVFGLTTVMWNQDSKDWCLADTGGDAPGCAANTGAPQSDSQLMRSLRNWFSGSQSPGLIVLEHEHHNRSITAFIESYPLIQSAGWTVKNIPQLLSRNWYANAADNTSTPVSLQVGSGLSAASSAQILASSDSSQTETASPRTTTGSKSSDHSASGIKGWESLTKGAQIGIIVAAGLVAVILAGVVAFCLWRRKKSAAYTTQRMPSPVSGLKRFSAQPHPYNRFDDSPTISFNNEKGSPKGSEKKFEMPTISLPTLVQEPLISPRSQEATGLLTIPPPANKIDSRISGMSMYSQGSTAENDPFASSPTKVRKSAFHLPNRFQESPYADASKSASNAWI